MKMSYRLFIMVFHDWVKDRFNILPVLSGNGNYEDVYSLLKNIDFYLLKYANN